MHKNNLFSSCIFQVGTSLSPLTVNRGRSLRGGRVPSWHENCFLRQPIFCGCPPRFQCFSRYRLLLLAPFLRRRGSFCSGTLLFRPSFSILSFLIFLRNKKRRMRAFHSPRRLDAKKFLIRLFVIQFFLVCWVKISPT